MADFTVDPLFVAVPELMFETSLLDYLLKREVITAKQWDKFMDARRAARKSRKIFKRMSSGSLVNRLLAVGGELVTVETVNILRSVNLLNERDGHALRLAIRALSASQRGGLPTDRAQLLQRLSRVAGVGLSFETIDLLRTAELITPKEAERLRGGLRSGTVVNESLAKARRSKNLLDALIIMGNIPVSKPMVSGMVQAGLLTPKIGRAYNALIDLGVKEWQVMKGTRAVEGYRRRLILALTGSMNAPLLDALLTLKVIDRQTYQGLQTLEIISRQVNDTLLESMIARKYRVKPNEAPIRTYARASRTQEAAILRLLAEASRDASKEARQLADLGRTGATARSRQYRLTAAAMHNAMRDMWEGVGYLVIRGESQVAEAAAESVFSMQKNLMSGKWAQHGDALLWQAKAGVDSYISREENTHDLSRRVYKNIALWQGQVDKRIALSLLQGKSPAEVALDVRKYIDPNVRGGVSYAAMRLARTEINNAFHFSTIRFTRENPWVRGYKWNLSGSHGRPDVCNQMADRDHDNLGRGVYKKANVPGKPHPHCLCYLTVVQMSPEEFIRAHNAGRFKSFYRTLERGSVYGEDRTSGDFAAYARSGFGNLRNALV